MMRWDLKKGGDISHQKSSGTLLHLAHCEIFLRDVEHHFLDLLSSPDDVRGIQKRFKNISFNSKFSGSFLILANCEKSEGC